MCIKARQTFYLCFQTAYLPGAAYSEQHILLGKEIPSQLLSLCIIKCPNTDISTRYVPRGVCLTQYARIHTTRTSPNITHLELRGAVESVLDFSAAKMRFFAVK